MEHGAKGRVTNPRLCNRHVGCWVVGCTNRCAARRCLREVGSPQERGSSSRLAREPIALVESFGPPCQPARQSRPVGRIFAVQDGSGSDHESEVVPTGMVASVFFLSCCCVSRIRVGNGSVVHTEERERLASARMLFSFLFDRCLRGCLVNPSFLSIGHVSRTKDAVSSRPVDGVVQACPGTVVVTFTCLHPFRILHRFRSVERAAFVSHL
mmetsp:Transcript_9012/g.31990  ORF Transcript_9012/g.31990 Transcript_9012/m.31990 type:complete len:211 (-) Transcript_9012:1344-1976(-)